jgi:hypothetical protein
VTASTRLRTWAFASRWSCSAQQFFSLNENFSLLRGWSAVGDLTDDLLLAVRRGSTITLFIVVLLQGLPVGLLAKTWRDKGLSPAHALNRLHQFRPLIPLGTWLWHHGLQRRRKHRLPDSDTVNIRNLDRWRLCNDGTHGSKTVTGHSRPSTSRPACVLLAIALASSAEPPCSHHLELSSSLSAAATILPPGG